MIRPKLANDPFEVFSIYFNLRKYHDESNDIRFQLVENLQATNDKELQQKLKPWERSYFQKMNNQMRAQSSVNNVEVRSAAFRSISPQDAHFGSGDRQFHTNIHYRKYARSIRR